MTFFLPGGGSKRTRGSDLVAAMEEKEKRGQGVRLVSESTKHRFH